MIQFRITPVGFGDVQEDARGALIGLPPEPAALQGLLQSVGTGEHVLPFLGQGLNGETLPLLDKGCDEGCD